MAKAADKRSEHSGRKTRGQGRKGRPQPSDNAEPLLTAAEVAELPHHHAQFVAEFLADPQPSTAAAKAGMHPVHGNKLLHRPQIAAALALARQRLVDRTNVDTPRVLAELARIAFFDIRQLYDANGRLLEPQELDDATAAAVQSVEVEEIYEWEGEGKAKSRVNTGRLVKYKTNSKMAALHDLCEHLGLLVKNVRVGGEVNVNHTDDRGIDWDALPMELRLQVLEHWQQARQKQLPASAQTVVNSGELRPVEHGLKELPSEKN